MMKKRHGFSLILFVLLTAFLVFSLRAADSLPQKFYKRVIVLAPNLAEIMAYLDLDTYIVGRARFCDYPPRIKKIPLVGDFSNPNEELIVSLNPDAIFSVDIEQAKVKEMFSKLGIPVVTFSFNRLKDITAAMYRILGLTGARTPERLKKIKTFDTKLQQAKASKLTAKGFFVIWYKPLMVAGKNSFINDIMEYAGISNLAQVNRQYSQINPEDVLVSKPDVIILSFMATPEQLKDFRKLFGSYKFKKIIDDIDPDILVRAGPRVIEGIKRLKSEVMK